MLLGLFTSPPPPEGKWNTPSISCRGPDWCISELLLQPYIVNGGNTQYDECNHARHAREPNRFRTICFILSNRTKPRDSALGQPLRMACSLLFLQRERGTHHLSRGLTGLFQSCCCNHCEWRNHTIRSTQSRKRCSLSKPTPDIRSSRANLHHSFSNNMFSEIMYLGERCRDCACTIPRSVRHIIATTSQFALDNRYVMIPFYQNKPHP